MVKNTVTWTSASLGTWTSWDLITMQNLVQEVYSRIQDSAFSISSYVL